MVDLKKLHADNRPAIELMKKCEEKDIKTLMALDALYSSLLGACKCRLVKFIDENPEITDEIVAGNESVSEKSEFLNNVLITQIKLLEAYTTEF